MASCRPSPISGALPRAALLLLALLLAPAASAAPSFELSLHDAPGDVVTMRGAPTNRTGMDLVGFASTSDGANITQTVTFASSDFWSGDRLTLMELFRDSGDDGRMYWVEVVHIFEQTRYYSYAFLRNGSYDEATPIHVETSVRGANVTVRLQAAAFPPEATCLHVNVIAEHEPVTRTKPDPQEARDTLAPADPACRLPPSDDAPPTWAPDTAPPGGIAVNLKTPPEPPGTRTPVPGFAPAALAPALVAAALLLRRR